MDFTLSFKISIYFCLLFCFFIDIVPYKLEYENDLQQVLTPAF